MKFVLGVFLFILTVASMGADKILNGIRFGGGNASVCRDEKQKILSAEMLDSADLRIFGGHLDFDPQEKTWQKKLKAKLKEWAHVAPLRMKQYQTWAETFLSETQFLSGVTISAIQDYGPIVTENQAGHCRIQPVAFQRADEVLFPGDQRYVVDLDVWNVLDENQRAVLVLHELVYRESLRMNPSSAVPTRKLTQLLVSKKVDAELYVQTVAKMPLGFLEYGGLKVDVSACKDVASDSSECVGRSLQFFPSGKLKYLTAVGNYSSQLDLPGFSGGAVSRVDKASFIFNEDRTVRALTVQGLLGSSHFQIRSTDGVRKHDLTYQCPMGAEGRSCSFSLEDHQGPDALPEFTRETVPSAPLSESMIYQGKNARIEFLLRGGRSFAFLDKIDFSVFPSGFCFKNQPLEVAPEASWIQNSPTEKIEQIRLVISDCATGEWLKLVNSSGLWRKQENRWIKE